jgi:hypothetical protein
VLQAEAELLPVIKEMLLFLVRGFRAGRGLEDVIEDSRPEHRGGDRRAQNPA